MPPRRGSADVTDVLTTESVWAGASDSALTTAFDDVDGYPYDLDAARALVEEAGATGEEIVIATAPISNDFAVTSQATVAAAQSIGLKAKIETVSPSAYTALFSDPSAREGIDLFYTSWYLSSPDPLEMYAVLRTGEFSNYGGWSDPEFDAIVNEAVAIDDPAAAQREDRAGAADRQRAAALAAAVHRADVALPRREDHRRRAVDRVPLLPMGGHDWRPVASPRRAPRRTAAARRPPSAGSRESSAGCC